MPATNAIKLVVGLGNPGSQYASTRHNAGYWFVENLARRYHIPLKPEAKFHGLAGRGEIEGHEVRLLLPSTYMNRSGQAVAALAKFYQIPADSILVVHDELDLPPGQLRLKHDGGHGGHNGLRDIHPVMGSNYHRLRVGIGHPGHRDLVTGHVLGTPPAADRQRIEQALDQALEVMPQLLSGQHDQVRQKLHSLG